ncbi:hypothetical protein BD310DRAFT_51804 [Dichomitus squalens]|uniref:Secreted protein n=1 Tax=Dichomitus squalens TaxID=114155 RepID=A0A4Q9Q530_9APHY|nr:hypothetical protein BD310DRAFT_51804 [Dichomitus squalens]
MVCCLIILFVSFCWLRVPISHHVLAARSESLAMCVRLRQGQGWTDVGDKEVRAFTTQPDEFQRTHPISARRDSLQDVHQCEHTGTYRRQLDGHGCASTPYHAADRPERQRSAMPPSSPSSNSRQRARITSIPDAPHDAPR